MTPRILSLPTEILQSIYLHGLSPNIPRASPVFASALSTDYFYKITFLHAFWNTAPLFFAKATPEHPYQPNYEPGPHLRRLFYPVPVPLPEVGVEDTEEWVNLQKIVLGCRWCTFNNAKRFLEEAMQAVMKDLLSTFDLLLSQDDQTRLNSFIANLPPNSAKFNASSLDDRYSLDLKYPRPFATGLVATYHGPDARFNQEVIPNLTIIPTKILIIPSQFLTGIPEWTQEKINFLKMLSGIVNIRTLSYRLEAFHEGMRNAIVQDHHDALLTLLCLATRFATYANNSSTDDSPFEPPEELFRLVARQGIHQFAATSDGCSRSEDVKESVPISIRLFTLLLRVHAESMPMNDPDIEAWANRVSAYQEGSKKFLAFATWVLDWSSKERGSDIIDDLNVWVDGDCKKVRRPLFRGGAVSRFRMEDGMEDEMAMRFFEIFDGSVVNFDQEIESVGELWP